MNYRSVKISDSVLEIPAKCITCSGSSDDDIDMFLYCFSKFVYRKPKKYRTGNSIVFTQKFKYEMDSQVRAILLNILNIKELYSDNITRKFT